MKAKRNTKWTVLVCLVVAAVALAEVSDTAAARKQRGAARQATERSDAAGEAGTRDAREAAPAGAAAGEAGSGQGTDDLIGRWRKLVGNAAPSRITTLLGIVHPVQGQDLAARFEPDPSGGARYVADDLALDIHLPIARPFRVEDARIVLEPSADGASMRFEISGSAFGAPTRPLTDGTVVWGAGPLGGDKLTARLHLQNAQVEALRAAFPERFDPSFTGAMSMQVDADGIVGESTSEEAPATPLRGKISGSIDWSLFGRTAPLQFSSDFSIDDRMLRLSGGQMAWQNLTLSQVKGTAGVRTSGDFRLSAAFGDVDAGKVAADWDVPEPWRPQAIVRGKIEFFGKPGESFIAYDAESPEIFVPAMAGYPVRLKPTRIAGRLAAINGDVIASFRPGSFHVGPFDLGDVGFGLRWFREHLQVNIANTTLWGSDAAVTATYRAPEHPAATFTGKIGPIAMNDLAPRVVPALSLDVEGMGEAAFRAGQDIARNKYFVGRAGIRNGRWGSDNLFEKLMEALAAADPALALPAASASLVPRHKSGRGTPGDRILFAFAQREQDYEIGGVLVRAGETQLEADGRMTRDGALQLQGHVHLPAQVTDALVSSAPWAKALRVAPAAGTYVHVFIGGTAAAPTIALTPQYVELVAQAKAGRPVEAPRNVAVKSLADDQLPTLGIDIE
ncbi:MAG TPA: hypothetical protein VEC57_07260 [Candidatus Limnocylindrales bacterium]|nr:hypothetical protein [Candidatus Limnocylindrales bacterium]